MRTGNGELTNNSKVMHPLGPIVLGFEDSTAAVDEELDPFEAEGRRGGEIVSGVASTGPSLEVASNARPSGSSYP